MCGEPTSAGDRWLQTAHHTTAGALRARGFGPALPATLGDDQPLLDCGAIAPLHRACAERALEHCPHLGRQPDRTLKPFPEAWIIVPLWLEAKSNTPPVRSMPVVSFLQLLGVEPTPA